MATCPPSTHPYGLPHQQSPISLKPPFSSFHWFSLEMTTCKFFLFPLLKSSTKTPLEKLSCDPAHRITIPSANQAAAPAKKPSYILDSTQNIATLSRRWFFISGHIKAEIPLPHRWYSQPAWSWQAIGQPSSGLSVVAFSLLPTAPKSLSLQRDCQMRAWAMVHKDYRANLRTP